MLNGGRTPAPFCRPKRQPQRQLFQPPLLVVPRNILAVAISNSALKETVCCNCRTFEEVWITLAFQCFSSIGHCRRSHVTVGTATTARYDTAINIQPEDVRNFHGFTEASSIGISEPNSTPLKVSEAVE